MIDPHRLYTIPESWPHTGLRHTSTFRAIRRGALIAVKVGRSTRIRGSDLLAFQAALRPANPLADHR